MNFDGLMYIIGSIPMFVVSMILLLSNFVIYLLDNTYFAPLFSNPFGILIIALIVVLYITYIIIVKKIIRVKEL